MAELGRTVLSCRRGRQRDAGFILAVTLWLLAAMAVVAAVIAVWSLEQVREASAYSARSQARQDMIGTRDTLLYLFATTDRTLAGLPMQRLRPEQVAQRRLDEFGYLDVTPRGDELRLDDRVYGGVGGLNFSIQDESGLFSLFWPQARDLDALLARYGVAEDRIPALRDHFLDYIDDDDFNRLHGAEARDYERLKRPAPANRRLLQGSEVQRIPGWDELPSALREEFAGVVSTHRAGPFNLNTAPPALLRRWLPGCPAVCESLLQMRDAAPFRTSPELAGRLGIVLPGDVTDYAFGSSDTQRLTFWGGQGAAWRVHVRLTPLADRAAPWRVLSAYTVPRLATHDAQRPTGNPLLTDPASDRR